MSESTKKIAEWRSQMKNVTKDTPVVEVRKIAERLAWWERLYAREKISSASAEKIIGAFRKTEEAEALRSKDYEAYRVFSDKCHVEGIGNPLGICSWL